MERPASLAGFSGQHNLHRLQQELGKAVGPDEPVSPDGGTGGAEDISIGKAVTAGPVIPLYSIYPEN